MLSSSDDDARHRYGCRIYDFCRYATGLELRTVDQSVLRLVETRANARRCVTSTLCEWTGTACRQVRLSAAPTAVPTAQPTPAPVAQPTSQPTRGCAQYTTQTTCVAHFPPCHWAGGHCSLLSTPRPTHYPTVKPTKLPTTHVPTKLPTTHVPTKQPATHVPTKRPVTRAPTRVG